MITRMCFKVLSVFLILVLLSGQAVCAYAEETPGANDITQNFINEEVSPDEISDVMENQEIIDTKQPEKADILEEDDDIADKAEDTEGSNSVSSDTVSDNDTNASDNTESEISEEISSSIIQSETSPDRIEITSAHGASGKCGENVNWELTTSGVLTISGTGAMDDYEDYSNNAQTAPWREYNDGITKIVISNGITKIGSFAFCGAKAKGNLVIPDSVTEIGEGAFAYCSKLNGNLTLPSNITVIKKETFENCPFTGALNLPSGITEIGEYAFEDNEFTGDLIIPNSVKVIARGAFNGGFNGKAVLPAGLESVDSSIINECDGLTKVINNSQHTVFLPSLKNDSWVNLDNPGLIIGKISNGTAIRKSQSTGTGYGVNGTCGDNATWEYYKNRKLCILWS